MITPKDEDYKETKAVLNGEIKANKTIIKLSKWIEQQFDIKVLHVVEDFLDTLNKPRLIVVLEEYNNVDSFKDNTHNYDGLKQSMISSKYEEICGDPVQSDFSLFRKKKKDKYFVCFSAYNPVAKSEIVSKITPGILAGFKKKHSIKPIWQIHDTSTGMIVFVHKDSEIEAFRNDPIIEQLKSDFYKLVEPHDKNNLFSEAEIGVYVDSKQNFDETYESNWFYYYH